MATARKKPRQPLTALEIPWGKIGVQVLGEGKLRACYRDPETGQVKDSPAGVQKLVDDHLAQLEKAKEPASSPSPGPAPTGGSSGG